jgi:hypothetical protein
MKEKKVTKPLSGCMVIIGMMILPIFVLGLIKNVYENLNKTVFKPTCTNPYKNQPETEYLALIARGCFDAEVSSLNANPILFELHAKEKILNIEWSPTVLRMGDKSGLNFTPRWNFQSQENKEKIFKFCENLKTIYQIKDFIPLEIYVIQNYQPLLQISITKQSNKCKTKILKLFEFREPDEEKYATIYSKLLQYTYTNSDDFIEFLRKIFGDYEVSYVSKKDTSNRPRNREYLPPNYISLHSKDGLLDNTENLTWNKILLKLAEFRNLSNQPIILHGFNKNKFGEFNLIMYYSVLYIEDLKKEIEMYFR